MEHGSRHAACNTSSTRSPNSPLTGTHQATTFSTRTAHAKSFHSFHQVPYKYNKASPIPSTLVFPAVFLPGGERERENLPAPPTSHDLALLATNHTHTSNTSPDLHITITPSIPPSSTTPSQRFAAETKQEPNRPIQKSGVRTSRNRDLPNRGVFRNKSK